MAFAIALGLALGVPGSAALAGPIETACLRSDRPAATRVLCGCIQRVADDMLSRGDQRRAARFFRDPEEAQRVRLSDTAADDAFWDRWTQFGSRAEALCAG